MKKTTVGICILLCVMGLVGCKDGVEQEEPKLNDITVWYAYYGEYSIHYRGTDDYVMVTLPNVDMEPGRRLIGWTRGWQESPTTIYPVGEELRITEYTEFFPVIEDFAYIQYHANGAIETGEPSKKYFELWNEEYGKLILGQQCFEVPKGKVFCGWNTKEDGSGVHYSERQIVRFSELKVLDLYAIWGDVPEIECELNDDGNSYKIISVSSVLPNVIVLPERYNDKPITAIGESLLSGRTSLTVIVPKSIKVIEDYVFKDCEDIEIVFLGTIDSLGYKTFANCKDLRLIVCLDSLPNYVDAYKDCSDFSVVFKKESIINPHISEVQSSFSGCSALTSVSFEDGVRGIGANAFANCTGLTNVEFPSSIIQIADGAFHNCSNLETITFNGFCLIGEGGFSYYGAFENCINLTTINTLNGISINSNRTFSECQKLKEIHIVDLYCYYGENIFKNCIELETVTVESWKGWKFWDGYMPKGCFSGCVKLKELPNLNGLVGIGDGAFDNCQSIKEVYLPRGISYLGSCFSNCTNLEIVSLPLALKTINGTFTNCVKLKEIDLPETVESISNAFYGCSSLENVVIPEGVTSIGAYAFHGCSSLSDIVIPERVTSIGAYAFYGCSSLSDIVIPERVISIDSYAFSRCVSLDHIVIPSGVTAIYDSTFASCTNLATIVIPEGVISIYGSAFSFCINITSITIPQSVEYIGTHAFATCTSLTSISFKGSVDQWGDIRKEWLWKVESSVKQIICSDGVVRL